MDQFTILRVRKYNGSSSRTDGPLAGSIPSPRFHPVPPMASEVAATVPSRNPRREVRTPESLACCRRRAGNPIGHAPHSRALQCCRRHLSPMAGCWRDTRGGSFLSRDVQEAFRLGLRPRPEVPHKSVLATPVNGHAQTGHEVAPRLPFTD